MGGWRARSTSRPDRVPDPARRRGRGAGAREPGDRDAAARDDAVAADQGALLTFLVRLVGARVAVEVGTFTGYGAICIARGLAEGGRLTCSRSTSTARSRTAQPRGRGRRRTGVRSRSGPPRPRSRACPAEPHIDFAYVDADKPGYPAYYDALVDRVRPGGLLVLDNTLLGGRVLDPQDDRTRTMAALNDRIASDVRVDSVLIGLADGMTIVRPR